MDMYSYPNRDIRNGIETSPPRSNNYTSTAYPPTDYRMGVTQRNDDFPRYQGRWDNPSFDPPLDYTIAPKWEQTPRSFHSHERNGIPPKHGKYQPPYKQDSWSSSHDNRIRSGNIHDNRNGFRNEPNRYRERDQPTLYNGNYGNYDPPVLPDRLPLPYGDGVPYTDSPKKHKLKTRRNDNDSGTSAYEGRCSFIDSVRVFTLFLLIWDLANDWILNALGPSPFNTVNKLTCTVNTDLLEDFEVNQSTIDTSYCSDPEPLFIALSVFVIISSLVTIIQCIDILLEITVSLTGRKTIARLLKPQGEICLAIFVEEIGQAFISAMLLVTCSCQSDRLNINLFSLLASISAVLSLTFRFATSFPQMSEDNGCCNQWWRCCCCRDADYCCRIRAREFFCTCNVPVPFFCCTLRCKNCKCHPVTWCKGVLKALSCYCSCCRHDDADYGIRLVNIFGLFLLWIAVIVQIVIFVI